MTPDRLAVGPAADGSAEPPPCALDAPAAPVAVLEVLEPTPGGATPPPDTSPPVPVVPRDEPPDRAAGGDAPTPPPLTDEETPVVPPAPDPGAASQVVTGDTADARHRLDAALERLEASSGRVDALEGRAQRLESAERELEAERDRLATRIARVRAEMGRCAADAYEEAVDAGTDFREPGTGAALMKVLLVESVAEYERLLARQAEVLAELQIAASDRAVRQPALDDAEAERRALAAQVASRTNEMNSFLGGGEIAVSGFRFPVGAGHSFSDTWHTPRAGGRRHQGTDIFADEGTPLRAVERGALARVGSDVLGGNKLWLVGESGTHYYYAHLSDYAADMGDGMVVAAGQVIGYVGNTGDARTTPPHLHFEVHPGGGSAVNGYPMLVAADTGAPAPSDEPSAPVGRDEAAPATEAAAPDPSTATTEEAGPRRVAVGRSGQVYVADTAHDRVQRLDEDGVRLGAWGESGRADGQFRHPSGVGVGPDGSVYVADAHNNRIQRFTPTGRFIAEWGTTGDGPGQFNHPADVAVSGEGDVFVADTYNNRVQVFDADGGHLDSWGTFGADEGRLAHPAGVVVDADGEVLVADTFNGRVQRFTASGRFLAAFGSGPLVDDGPRRPGDMTVDQDGTVWVTDQVDDRVREYDGSGGLVRTWTPAELVGAEAELTPVAASLTAG
jgi:murein DD-endopeptidase MepM/ murein hydrolase activator NlpD